MYDGAGMYAACGSDSGIMMTNDQALDITTVVIDGINEELGAKVLNEPAMMPGHDVVWATTRISSSVDLQVKEVNRGMEWLIKKRLAIALTELRDMIDGTLEKLV